MCRCRITWPWWTRRWTRRGRDEITQCGMTTRYTAYAVFDESGDAGKGARSSRYLVVAAIVCDNLEPLRRAVIRIRRGMPKTLRGRAEVKAFETPEAARPILQALAGMNARVVAAVVDKRNFGAGDPVEIVSMAYAACTSAILRNEVGIIATVDRPFTQAAQRDALVAAMNDAAEEMGKRLVVVLDDSRHEKALQAADVVAWAFFQKYERGAIGLWQVMRSQIIAEVTLP